MAFSDDSEESPRSNAASAGRGIFGIVLILGTTVLTWVSCFLSIDGGKKESGGGGN